VFRAFFGGNICVASDIWVLLNEIPQNTIEKLHLRSIDKAPNDTSYFSQYLVVKPIESC
jgi:hypothetical protein